MEDIDKVMSQLSSFLQFRSNIHNLLNSWLSWRLKNSSLCSVYAVIGSSNKGFNPSQTLFWRKEHIFWSNNFNFIDEKMLLRMVCITCVLHEPITGQCVQRAGNMEEVIFWDKTTAAIPLWPSTWIIYLWLNLLVNNHKWSIHRPPSSRWG